jgi:hypothetical protein
MRSFTPPPGDPPPAYLAPPFDQVRDQERQGRYEQPQGYGQPEQGENPIAPPDLDRRPGPVLQAPEIAAAKEPYARDDRNRDDHITLLHFPAAALADAARIFLIRYRPNYDEVIYASLRTVLLWHNSDGSIHASVLSRIVSPEILCLPICCPCEGAADIFLFGGIDLIACSSAEGGRLSKHVVRGVRVQN